MRILLFIVFWWLIHFKISAQPTISSFTPTAGSVGTVVTINGSGFSTTPANNIVWFGTVRATVSAATTTQLTTTVPSGASYAPITVTVNGLTRQTLNSFVPTFASNGVIDEASFLTKQDLPASNNVLFITSGDLDLDGRADLVAANFSSTLSTISIFRNNSNNGNISFETNFNLSTGIAPSNVVLADIDGDGKLDICVTHNQSNFVRVWRNQSTGGLFNGSSFPEFLDIPKTDGGYGLAVADIDRDGKQDLIVTNQVSQTISVIRNTSIIGNISFEAKVDFAADFNNLYDIAVADIDGDGRLDIAVSAYIGNNILVYRNVSTVGTISLNAKVLINANRPIGIKLDDVDDDSKPDLIVTNYDSPNTVSIYKNQAGTGAISSGSFQLQVPFTVASLPQYTSVADINGDGKKDLAVSALGGDALTILRNIGTTNLINSNTFTFSANFPTNNEPGELVVTDFDNDGRPDIAVTNYDNGGSNSSISIYRNITRLPTPTITNFSPTFGVVGTTVTITGTNFSTVPANNIVYFGAVRATVATASSTQLTVTVPSGATQSPISVNVNNLTAYSSAQFKPIFTGQGILDASTFASRVDIPVGANLQLLVPADIDGDGKVDLIASRESASSISVYRNTSTTGSFTTSSFATGFNFATNTPAWGIEPADLDGDGKLDLIVANYEPGGTFVSVFRNTATSGVINNSSFATRLDLPSLASAPYFLAVHDMDSDGKPDIVSSIATSAGIAVQRNLSTPGNIMFSSPIFLQTGLLPVRPVIEDFDGDGKKDLAFLHYNSTFMSLYRNISTPGSLTTASFSTRVDIPVPQFMYDLRAADLDNDGKPDLVASYNNNSTSAQIYVFKNQATSGSLTTSSFAAAFAYTTLTGPNHLALADVTGDGKIDIVSSNYQNTTLSVLRNTTSASIIDANSFATRIDLAVGSISGSGGGTAIADFDGDGRMDLATPNKNATAFSLFRNQASFAPPTITSFAPASGALGTTVAITGTNFSAVSANNIVYFGAVRANVTAATATQLTVVVPVGAGSHPISVTTNNLTAYTNTNYRVTNSTGIAIDASSLQTRSDFITQSSPYKVTAADIDNDGKLDLISANASGSITLFKNTAVNGVLNSSSFENGVNYPAPVNIAGPTSVLTADFDGDGKLDIATANYGNSASFSVFRNKHISGSFTSGSLEDREDFPTQNGTFELASGDLDLDGKPDIVVVSDGLNIISVYRNVSVPGNIAFATKQDYPAGAQPSGVEIADIDGDGKPEVLTANFAASTLSVFRNTSTPGSISLAAKFDYPTATNPYRVIASDFDNDGKIDVALSGNSVSILRNTATNGVINAGSFAGKQDFPTNTGALGIVAADFDGDGKNDLAVGFSGLSTVSVYRNTSTVGISFAPKTDFTFLSSSLGVEAADLDGDGRQDLISANEGAARISVRRLQLNPIPTITTFTPTSGVVGVSVNITGTNFSTTPGNNIVYFGAVRATVSAATSTQLTVTVPVGATYSPISVTTNGLTATTARPFVPVVISGPAISFDAKTDVTTTNTNSFGEVIDIDGDGKIDIGVAQNFGFLASLFRNTSNTGSFSFATKIDFSQNPISSVGFADVDGDGKPDLLTTNGTANTLSIYRNISTSGVLTTGSFDANKTNLSATDAYITAVGDLDGDGKLEIVVTRRSANAVTVFRNMATTGIVSANLFSADVNATTNISPYDVKLADIDGDGKLDILTSSTGATSIFRNTSTLGQLSFATKFDLPLATGEGIIGVGDIDGDGKLDIALSNGASDVVTVFRNTSVSGTFSFASSINFPTGDNPGGVTLADVNGDTKPELIVSNTSGNSISVLRNNATSGVINTGSFDSKIDYTAGNSPIMPIVADIDGDTRLDILSINYGTGSTISIFRNTASAAQPTAQPTSLARSNPQPTSFTVSFTAASGNPTGYLVLRKTGSSPTEIPVDGVTYVVNNDIGTSKVVYVGNALTFNESGLTSNTNYFYDVFAYNGSGITINYNTINPLEGTLTTLATEPTAQPTTFSTSNRSATGFDVSFNAATGTPNGYLILERNGGTPTGVPQDGVSYSVGATIGDGVVVQVGASTSFSKTGLTAGSSRNYAIFSFNGSGGSLNYNIVNPLTGQGITLAAEPANQPTGLSFTNIGLNSFTLTFTPAVGTPTGYIILRRTNVQTTDLPADGIDYSVGQTIGASLVVSVGSSATINETGLVSGTIYFYSIFSFNGATTNRNYLTTNPLQSSQTTLVSEPTAQPTALPFSNLNTTSVTVNFNAAAGNPAGYIVLRQSGSAPTELPEDGKAYSAGSVIGTSTVAFIGNSTSFTDSGLNPATQYFYRVYSFNGSGSTANYLTVNPLLLTTFTIAIEPGGVPTNLLFTNLQSNSLTLSFTPSTGTTGYIVLRRQGNSPTEIPENGTVYTSGQNFNTSRVVSVGIATTVVDNGLLPETEYFYDIYSFNGSGSTINYSSIALENNRITLATEPTAQPTLGITNVGANSLTLNVGAAVGNPSGYLVIRRVGASPLDIPTDGTTYTEGQSLGASVVAYIGPANATSISNLVNNTTYFFDAFSFNGNGASINYLTGNPTEATQTTAIGDVTPPIVSHTAKQSHAVNVALNVTATISDAESAISQVKLSWRKVTATSTAFTIVDMTASGNLWSAEIPATAFNDLGVVYKITATSSGGSNTEVLYYTSVNFGEEALQIPATSIGFGNKQSNYRMIAIPLNMPSRTVTGIFGNVFGDYTDTRWVMYRYNGSKPVDNRFDKLSAGRELLPGEGYWLLANVNSTSVPLLNGTSLPTNAPFTINLSPGWNQIGNPFTFDIDWQDVLAANSSQAINLSSKPRKYNGSQNDNSDVIKIFEGFYIQNKSTSVINITIPFTRSIGATRIKEVKNSIDKDSWEINLFLENGDQNFVYGSFGMHPNAKNDVDVYDDASMPLFADYLDYYTEVGGEQLAKNVVKTNQEFTWHFTIRSFDQLKEAQLIWDNTFFGDNAKHLWLVEETTGIITDMRLINSLDIGRANGKKFKLLYGSREYVEKASLPPKTIVNVYPNPLKETTGLLEIVLPFTTNAKIDLLSLTGKEVYVIAGGYLKEGRHTFTLADKTKNLPAGIYLVRLQTDAGAFNKKILVEK